MRRYDADFAHENVTHLVSGQVNRGVQVLLLPDGPDGAVAQRVGRDLSNNQDGWTVQWVICLSACCHSAVLVKRRLF